MKMVSMFIMAGVLIAAPAFADMEPAPTTGIPGT